LFCWIRCNVFRKRMKSQLNSRRTWLVICEVKSIKHNRTANFLLTLGSKTVIPNSCVDSREKSVPLLSRQEKKDFRDEKNWNSGEISSRESEWFFCMAESIDGRNHDFFLRLLLSLTQQKIWQSFGFRNTNDSMKRRTERWKVCLEKIFTDECCLLWKWLNRRTANILILSWESARNSIDFLTNHCMTGKMWIKSIPCSDIWWGSSRWGHCIPWRTRTSFSVRALDEGRENKERTRVKSEYKSSCQMRLLSDKHQ
jgi:hypothetical protein